MNLNANNDTYAAAGEKYSPRRRGFNKVYEEFKTYQNLLKTVLEDGVFLLRCDKKRYAFL